MGEPTLCAMPRTDPEGPPTKVLVVDDDRLLCAGLTSILHTTPDLVVVAAVEPAPADAAWGSFAVRPPS